MSLQLCYLFFGALPVVIARRREVDNFAHTRPLGDWDLPVVASTPGESLPENKMAKPVKLAHVVYMTRRFDEMVHWYASVFEAAVVYRNPALAFLTYDDEHHRFAFANLDVLRPAGVGADDRGEIGVNHVGFTYAGIGDLLLTYDRLKNAGVRPYWTVHHGTTLSLYYKDPDGNRMEFQVDCGTVEQANAYMASEAFAANPVGVMYDADNLLARYRAGVRPEDLLQMPSGLASDIPLEHGMT